MCPCTPPASESCLPEKPHQTGEPAAPSTGEVRGRAGQLNSGLLVCDWRRGNGHNKHFFLLIPLHEIIDNLSSFSFQTFILSLCLIERYSQPARLWPAAKQLFILKFAFKPSGIEIHQGTVSDITKLRATLSRPRSVARCLTRMRANFIALAVEI